eukprot:2575003-Rhodomonas_salina.2
MSVPDTEYRNMASAYGNKIRNLVMRSRTESSAGQKMMTWRRCDALVATAALSAQEMAGRMPRVSGTMVPCFKHLIQLAVIGADGLNAVWSPPNLKVSTCTARKTRAGTELTDLSSPCACRLPPKPSPLANTILVAPHAMSVPGMV